MKTLYKMQQDNTLSQLKKDDLVIYNGGFFSNCSFFTKDKMYKVTTITPTRIKLTCDISIMSIDIYPEGLRAFDFKEVV